MKLFFLPLLMLFIFSNPVFKPTVADKCEISLDKEILASDYIELSCKEFMNNRAFVIKNFNIKFPEEPAFKVENNKPSIIKYVNQLREGEKVAIFNIKGAYDGDQLIYDKKVPNFMITITGQR